MPGSFVTRSWRRLAAPVPAALFLVGCAGDYVAEPDPRSFTAPAHGGVSALVPETVLADLEVLLGEGRAPITYDLCDAAPEDDVCPDVNDNPSGGGVGGIILPLFLTVPSMEVMASRRDEAGGLFIDVDFEAYVNGIPPVCDDSVGTVTANANGSAVIEFSNFYCNWLAIGNVISQFELSVDRTDVEGGKFSGYYSIQFNGTGNAGGSGYYIAYASDAMPETGEVLPE